MTAEVETVAQEVIAVNGVEKEEVAAGDTAAEVTKVEANGIKSKMNGETPSEEAVPEEAAPINGAVENGAVENGEAVAEDAQANGDATAVAEETNNEAAEEVAKEPEAPPKVVLHTWPPIKNLPTTSMFCLKLETYMKMHSIPYEAHYGYKVGKNGKVPWIEYAGEKVSDSQNIIEFLNEKFEITHPDDKLADQQKHLARAIQVMLEENTYWGVQYNRFIDNFAEYKKSLSAHAGQTGIMFQASQKMHQRKVRSGLDMHGLGKHTKEEVYSIVNKDLKALSGLLGDQTYLLGEEVSTVDIIAFSLVAQITQSGLESPLSQFIESDCSNLMTHFNNMKELYWDNWDDVVLGDRAVVPLKKGFSFRKKKKVVKEDGTASPAAEENGVASEDTTPVEGEATAAAATTEETPAAETPAADAEAKTPEADAATVEATTDTPAAVPEAAATETTPAETTSDEPVVAAETPAETTAEEPVVNGEVTAEEKPAE